MMIDYIYEQPAVIRAAIQTSDALVNDFCADFSNHMPDRLYLIASGTSCNACKAAQGFMEDVLGIEVTVAPPSRLPVIHGERPLIALVSQGGNSTNILSAQKALSGHRCIAVTANTKGALAAGGLPCQIIPCGDENVGPKTKGYTATIVTLYLMALHAAKRVRKITADHFEARMADLLRMCSQMQTDLGLAENWIRANKEGLMTLGACLVVGKGNSAAVALEGSLKITETVLVPAMPFDFEEFLHGPACAMGENVAGFYLLPDDQDPDYARFLKVVEVHRKISPGVYTIGRSGQLKDARDCVLLPSRSRDTDPFELVLPFQLLGALLPKMLGIVDKGMDFFKQLDKALSIKVELEF